jgi:mannonate dehydratase
MKRRAFLKTGSIAALAAAGIANVEAASHAAKPSMEPIKITDIKVIMTAPERSHLVVVKVETSDPGLYGWGCATFTQRALTVKTAIEEYLRPFMIGKNPDNIEGLWQSMYVSSYWRNGPVLNNAISGIEMALWDIKGKRANMPVYQLLGGKARFAADLYAHASGSTFEEVEDSVRRWKEKGYRHVRAQFSARRGGSYGSGGFDQKLHPNLPPDTQLFEPDKYVRTIPKMFEHLRDKLGFDIHLLHDTHERITNAQALYLGKALEPYELFFWEDPLSPEGEDFFKHLRAHTITPIAMGELFNNPNEWHDIIKNQYIDFIRVHLSQIGGLLPGRKLAAFAEPFGVRTAWHGPGDNSPIGHACGIALDLVCQNFGIQEQHIFNEAAQDVFQGCLKIENGYCYANEAPGWGIEVDEELALEFPWNGPNSFDYHWGQTRKPDGSIIKP